MWGGTTTRSQLQQTINSLWRVSEVPEAPIENSVSPATDSTCLLSLAREKEIVSNLAFLSATTDNSQKVMAVCVEENSNREGITIRLSSNTGDLSVVTAGFRRLAGVLERAARRENPRAEDIDALVEQIVKLDISRILTRLRSRHVKSNKSAGKPALINQLYQAIHDKSIKPESGLMGGGVMAKVECMQNMFSKLEGISDLNKEEDQAHQLLGLIVRQAHGLTLATDLSGAFQGSNLDPSLQKHLPVAIGKLGRYYSVASELVSAARDRRCPIFHNIQVESFQIGIPVSVHAVGRIHAEVQLLFFYEMHPGHPRPRFICSSKSACYLCNLFFTLHGKFYVPRSHGRLYKKWILPDWLDIPAECRKDMAAITARLKTTLEAKIKGEANPRKRYCHPNESVLLPPAHWSPSVTSGTLAASQSTVRPWLTQLRDTNHVTPSREKTPLTPPKPPSEQLDSSYSEIEISPCNILDGKSSPDWEPINTIGYGELPYSKFITVATPLLHLRLNNLTLHFDFCQTCPCRLLITRVEDPMCKYHTVEVEDVPTSGGIRLGCLSHDSEELRFRLQIAGKGVICISLVWDNR